MNENESDLEVINAGMEVLLGRPLTKVVLRSVLGAEGQWLAVWHSSDGIKNLQGKGKDNVKHAVRRQVGENVQFYDLGSPEWQKEFG